MLVHKKLLNGAKRRRTGHEPINIEILAPTDQQHIIHRLDIPSIPQPFDHTSPHLHVRQMVQTDPVGSDNFADYVDCRLD